MKEYMICLSHFCEIHGPTSIICTEQFGTGDASPTTGDSLSSDTNSRTTCLSCQLTVPSGSGRVIRTPDDVDPDVVYLSQQYPASQTRYKVLRQIVMKCLSVETTYDDLKPIMFGDSTLGFAIAMSFKIKDNTARGSERKYALIVLAEDETELMASWDLVIASLSAFIRSVRAKGAEAEANQVTDVDNNERFYRRIAAKPKNLTELLGDDKFFIKTHLWACNLLKHLKT